MINPLEHTGDNRLKAICLFQHKWEWGKFHSQHCGCTRNEKKGELNIQRNREHYDIGFPGFGPSDYILALPPALSLHLLISRLTAFAILHPDICSIHAKHKTDGSLIVL